MIWYQELFATWLLELRCYVDRSQNFEKFHWIFTCLYKNFLQGYDLPYQHSLNSIWTFILHIAQFSNSLTSNQSSDFLSKTFLHTLCKKGKCKRDSTLSLQKVASMDPYRPFEKDNYDMLSRRVWYGTLLWKRVATKGIPWGCWEIMMETDGFTSILYSSN